MTSTAIRQGRPADLLDANAGVSEEDRQLQEAVAHFARQRLRPGIAIARECRTILGGAGITLDYPPLRHANNLESVLTYEGTSEVHTLVIGQALTGLSAYR